MIESVKELFQFLTNVEALIRWGGTLAVCAIIFVETGLFVGFFLPGDSLLVTAGIFAAAGYLDLWTLLLLGPLCAIAGNQLGYFIGHKAGQALYNRPDSMFFKKRHLERAHDFYEEHGPKTIILARFVPIVRTFVPPVAGAARMTHRRFFSYDIFGGTFWVWSLVVLGYFLGRAVPNINRHIHIVIAVVVFLSFLPAIFQVLRARRKKLDAVAPPVPDTRSEQE